MGWNPRTSSEMASSAEDSLQGGEGDRAASGSLRNSLPSQPSPTSAQGKQIFEKFTQAGAGGEAVGGLSPCGHSSGERGLGGHPWQACRADPRLGTPRGLPRGGTLLPPQPLYPERSLAETSREER